MSGSDAKRFGWTSLGLLLLVNLIAFSFFFSPGTGDVGTWARWMREIDANGLVGGYMHSDTDYPPLSFLLLAIVSPSAVALEVSRFVVLKFSLIVFLLASATCFYWFSRDLILTAALELALTLNSMGLGYLDIYVAPFLIVAFFLLQRGHFNAGLILFALSCSIKWQPLIIAPFICVFVLKSASTDTSFQNRRLASRVLPFVISGIVVAVPLFLIFGWKIFDALKRAMTYHRFLSAYGLNLCWIETWALHLLNPEKYGPLQNGLIDIFIVRDPLIVWPNKVLFCLSYAAILFAFARQPKTFERLIVYSILGYMAYFICNTGVHENHLFLVCCLAWILVFIDPGQLIRVINLSIATNANLFLFYGAFGQRISPVVAGFDITLLFAVANICLFAGFLIHTFRSDGLTWRFWRAPVR